MGKSCRRITGIQIEKYAEYLAEQERALLTIQKYTHDLKGLSEYLAGEAVTKKALLCWKEHLVKHYASSSVNGKIAALNGFAAYMGWSDLRIRPLKVQKNLFCREEKELTREEYVRLVQTAQKEGEDRLALVIQTICSTGIRVSELQYITVQAVQSGRTEVCNKGKRRTVFLPDKLCRLLKKYLHRQKRKTGPVFLTKNGNPLDRSNIWRKMKALCKRAGVDGQKVFPHNLRHLFARVYYSMEKDLSRLADILGHSNVNTTRIYTMESGWMHARQIGGMKLVIT